MTDKPLKFTKAQKKSIARDVTNRPKKPVKTEAEKKAARDARHAAGPKPKAPTEATAAGAIAPPSVAKASRKPALAPTAAKTKNPKTGKVSGAGKAAKKTVRDGSTAGGGTASTGRIDEISAQIPTLSVEGPSGASMTGKGGMFKEEENAKGEMVKVTRDATMATDGAIKSPDRDVTRVAEVGRETVTTQKGRQFVRTGEDGRKFEGPTTGTGMPPGYWETTEEPLKNEATGGEVVGSKAVTEVVKGTAREIEGGEHRAREQHAKLEEKKRNNPDATFKLPLDE